MNRWLFPFSVSPTVGSTFPASSRAKFPPQSSFSFVRGPLQHPANDPPQWSRAADNLGRTITIRAHVDALTGYGQLACGLIRELSRRGLPVQCVPMVAPWEPKEWGKAALLPDDVRSHLIAKNDEGWELLLSSPHHVGEVSPCVTLSMWESNRLPQSTVEILNRKQAILNPSEWGILSWDAAGVHRPMYKTNLPISDCFREYRPMPASGPFTFGLACRRAHGGLRKGVVQACECFLRAFPNEKDVRLRLKFYPDCPASDLPKDPRIEVIQAAYTEEQVADFLASLHCYVSTSQGEGYGLVQAQAMGVGRPVIGARAHAQAEYLAPENAYLAEYDLADAIVANPFNGYYLGAIFKPRSESVTARMREAYRSPGACVERGLAAHNRAKKMTWGKFGDEVLAALRVEGLPVV